MYVKPAPVVIVGTLVFGVVACTERDASCDACSVATTGEVILGDVEGPGAFKSVVLSAYRLSDGRWIVYDWNERGVLRAYAGDGTYIGTIGRGGQGPGEYNRPVPVVEAPDGNSIYVLDAGLGRITELSSDDFRPVETYPLPFVYVYRAVAFPGSRLLLGAVSFRDEQLGLPLHWVTTTGQVLRSFGADPPILGDLYSGEYFRQMAFAGSDGVWVAPQNAFRFEEWDTAGTLKRVLAPPVQWFPANLPFHFPTSPSDAPPSPRVIGAWGDDRGRLWTVANLAADSWRTVLDTFSTGNGVVRYRPRDNLEFPMYFSRVSVYDLRTNEVIAQRDLHPGFKGMREGGFVWTPFVDAVGAPRIRTAKLVLERSQE